MTTIATAKRRRASPSALALPATSTCTAAVLLLGAGRLHHALAFAVGSGNAHAGTFTTAPCVSTTRRSIGGCTIRRSGAAAPTPNVPSAHHRGIALLTALHAEAGASGGSAPGGSWSSPHNAQSSRRDHKTAMEGAILVEWEPISELERRIEDGIHYEHFPDFEHMFGSEEAQRLRKQARTARRARRRSGGGGGGGGSGWVDTDQVDSTKDYVNADNEMEDDNDAHLESAQGVFVGFRVTEEEVDRLRSADPADYSV